MKEIGKRLRMLRDNIHVSQDRLAKEFGITQSSINRYENGQTTPTVEIFRKYADFFDVSMDYIFARTDNPAGKAYGMHARLTPEKEEMRRFHQPPHHLGNAQATLAFSSAELCHPSLIPPSLWLPEWAPALDI